MAIVSSTSFRTGRRKSTSRPSALQAEQDSSLHLKPPAASRRPADESFHSSSEPSRGSCRGRGGPSSSEPPGGSLRGREGPSSSEPSGGSWRGRGGQPNFAGEPEGARAGSLQGGTSGALTTIQVDHDSASRGLHDSSVLARFANASVMPARRNREDH